MNSDRNSSFNFERRLRIGTRGSPLALAQARSVQDEWRRHYPNASESEIIIVKTTGDQVLDRPLAEIGGKGLFTRELDTALIDTRIDIAVHSMKDVPTFLPEEIVVPAMLPRADVRDCLLTPDGRTLSEVRDGAVVGTCSLRRRAQLLCLRPDLEIVDLRGNIQSRINKLRSGALDATMLAKAGMDRMKMHLKEAVPISTQEMIPAAAQGAVGIATLCNNKGLVNALATLNDNPTQIRVECERALLAALDGSCRTPIGAYSELNGEEISLFAVLANPDGKLVYRENKKALLTSNKALGLEVGLELKRIAGPDFLAHW